MFERLKEIRRTHLFLGIAILLAIPCYCFGLFVLWNSDNSNESGILIATIEATDLDEGPLAPTFTVPFITQTATSTPTITPTFTTTITYVLPVTDTPTPTMTNTQTLTNTPMLSPEPTDTSIPLPTNTATDTFAPSPIPNDTPIPTEIP